jgi:hypothetical protein
LSYDDFNSISRDTTTSLRILTVDGTPEQYANYSYEVQGISRANSSNNWEILGTLDVDGGYLAQVFNPVDKEATFYLTQPRLQTYMNSYTITCTDGRSYPGSHDVITNWYCKFRVRTVHKLTGQRSSWIYSNRINPYTGFGGQDYPEGNKTGVDCPPEPSPPPSPPPPPSPTPTPTSAPRECMVDNDCRCPPSYVFVSQHTEPKIFNGFDGYENIYIDPPQSICSQTIINPDGSIDIITIDRQTMKYCCDGDCVDTYYCWNYSSGEYDVLGLYSCLVRSGATRDPAFVPPLGEMVKTCDVQCGAPGINCSVGYQCCGGICIPNGVSC